MDEMSSSEAEEASESMMEDSEEMDEEEEEEDDYDPEPEPEEGLPSWAVPPWPEWDDGFVNAENWEENDAHAHHHRQFRDPSGTLLPSSLQISHWIRPDELMEPGKMVDPTNPIIDLINPNNQLCEGSDIIRYMLSEISELYEHGLANFFQLEGEGTAFVPNWIGSVPSWRPWDHIYSHCGAGAKGALPQLNKGGKYYVRLYYMGSWRRITVDDQIPVLKNGLLALPITSASELWPIFLVKGLLKIHALFAPKEVGSGVEKITSFSTISALTGWFPEWIDVPEPLDVGNLWKEFTEVLPKYQRAESVPVVNYWTTGKTKKERIEEEEEEIEREIELHKFDDLINDLFKYWWNILSLVDRDPTVQYIEFSGLDIPEIVEEDDPDEVEEEEPDHHSKAHPRKSRAAVKRKTMRSKSVISLGGNLSHTNLAEETTRTSNTELDSVAATEATKGQGKGKKDQEPQEASSTATVAPVQNSEQTVVDAADKSNKKGGKGKQNKKGKGKKRRSGSIPKGRKTEMLEEEEALGFEEEAEVMEGQPALEKAQSPKKTILVSATASKLLKQSFKSAPPQVRTAKDLDMRKIPMMQDILRAICRGLNVANQELVHAWEAQAGKKVPDIITVAMYLYPKAEEEGPVVPSFMYHPIQIAEVRDLPLTKDPNRPSTPLWKTFRWKTWAMKKGLIPMDVPHSQIRCIKARTPLALKTDWYHSRLGMTHIETEEDEALLSYLPEGSGEEPEEGCGGRNSLRSPEEGQQEGQGQTPTPPNSPPNANASPSQTSKKGHHGSSASMRKGKDKDKDHPKDKDKGKRKKSLVSVLQLNQQSEEEAWMEEEEEEMPLAPLPTPASEPAADNFPTKSCGSVWFHCDNVAPYIRKMCKVYNTKSLFGACFVLRRRPPLPVTEDIWAQFVEDGGGGGDPLVAHEVLQNYHEDTSSFNQTIKFDNSVQYLEICDFHLDKSRGVDSAFYMFNDGWREQEVIITVEVLQAADTIQYSKKVLAAAAVAEDPTSPLTNSNESDSDRNSTPLPPLVQIGVVVEPYDWRLGECSMKKQIKSCLTTSTWSCHLKLPAGRKIYRLWVAENPRQAFGICNTDPATMSSYSIKVSSKGPMFVGNRDDVFLYMTNEPMQVLQQSDALAHNIWTTFLLFGKPRQLYLHTFQTLRKSYYPDSLTKHVKSVHESFEDKFFSMILELVGGTMEPIMHLALKSFLLNPKLGDQILRNHKAVATFAKKLAGQGQAHGHDKQSKGSLLPKSSIMSVSHHNLNQSRSNTTIRTTSTAAPSVTVITDVTSSEILSQIRLHATIIIQSYCRGWLVRRLFQMRLRGHPKFPSIEFEIRKIAYLLATNTDSAFTKEEELSMQWPNPVEYPMNFFPENLDEEGQESEGQEMEIQPKTSSAEKVPVQFANGGMPSLVPNPPRWAVGLIHKLLQSEPTLLQQYPHYFQSHNHVKILETEGVFSSTWEAQNTCKPFFRRVIAITPTSNGEPQSCTCMIQLQLVPPCEAIMRVIDNDHRACMMESRPLCFIRRLVTNKLGYTILCYRIPPTPPAPPAATEGEEQEQEQEEQQEPPEPVNYIHRWRVRVITPTCEDNLVYRDEMFEGQHHHHHEHEQVLNAKDNVSSMKVKERPSELGSKSKSLISVESAITK